MGLGAGIIASLYFLWSRSLGQRRMGLLGFRGIRRHRNRSGLVALLRNDQGSQSPEKGMGWGSALLAAYFCCVAVGVVSSLLLQNQGGVWMPSRFGMCTPSSQCTWERSLESRLLAHHGSFPSRLSPFHSCLRRARLVVCRSIDSIGAGQPGASFHHRQLLLDASPPRTRATPPWSIGVCRPCDKSRLSWRRDVSIRRHALAFLLSTNRGFPSPRRFIRQSMQRAVCTGGIVSWHGRPDKERR